MLTQVHWSMFKLNYTRPVYKPVFTLTPRTPIKEPQCWKGLFYGLWDRVEYKMRMCSTIFNCRHVGGCACCTQSLYLYSARTEASNVGYRTGSSFCTYSSLCTLQYGIAAQLKSLKIITKGLFINTENLRMLTQLAHSWRFIFEV